MAGCDGFRGWGEKVFVCVCMCLCMWKVESFSSGLTSALCVCNVLFLFCCKFVLLHLTGSRILLVQRSRPFYVSSLLGLSPHCQRT